ncbi:MAG: YnbE family lipoprotein [Pseudomonadota bacterium]
MQRTVVAGAAAVVFLAVGCATVKVEAPDEPIEINLNVKIEQEVRIRLDEDIEDLITNNPDIF